MAQIYAVVYDSKSKKFIMAKKNQKGYFFKKDGEINSEGTKLHGAGKWALPGGKLEEKNVVEGALRELKEETGVKLTNYQNNPIVYTNSKKLFYGVCFDVGSSFDAIKGEIEKKLGNGKQAVEAILKGYEKGYKALLDEFQCPEDNELAIVEAWSFTDNRIKGLESDEDTDWFPLILNDLVEKL